MKIIYMKHIPFRGFYAITILNTIIIRKDMHKYDKTDKYYKMINHESIHFEQEKELLFIGFYLIYLLEYVFRLMVTLNTYKAYKTISFEQEAYSNQKNEDYLKHRKRFAMWRK